jgi:ArsR family metal-binding transcriptional regulator
MVEKYGSEPCQDRQKIRDLYQKNFFSLAGTIAPSPVQPLDDDISRAINKMHRRNQIYEMLPKIDCGACGAPTCMTFATDVVRGEADTDGCLFLTMKTFESMSRNLLEAIGKHSRKCPGNIERQDHEA